jgi:hypothetical protein
VLKSSSLFLFLNLVFGTVLLGQIVSSGTIEIPGTAIFDFDAGAIVPYPALTGDIFWDQGSPTTRFLQPSNLAGIVNLGSSVSFSTLTPAQLQAQTYCFGGAGISTSAGFACSINGSDVGSLLVVGDVFAVQTNSGNLAKAVVTSPLDPSKNHGLIIQWVTYANPGPPGTPAPPSFLLVLTGLVGAVGFFWRKSLRTAG